MPQIPVPENLASAFGPDCRNINPADALSLLRLARLALETALALAALGDPLGVEVLPKGSREAARKASDLIERSCHPFSAPPDDLGWLARQWAAEQELNDILS